jgi:hypothetical protein
VDGLISLGLDKIRNWEPALTFEISWRLRDLGEMNHALDVVMRFRIHHMRLGQGQIGIMNGRIYSSLSYQHLMLMAKPRSAEEPLFGI